MASNLESPIAQGAEEIRQVVTLLVTEQLKGIFPTEHWYSPQIYLVYVIAQGHGEQGGGFFRNADMVLLDSHGEFKSGRVEQYVGSDRSSWEFWKAHPQPAVDLDLVKYAPTLVLSLMAALNKGLELKEEPKDIRRTIDVLSHGSEYFSQVMASSRTALQEMTGEASVGMERGEDDFGSSLMKELPLMLAESGWVKSSPTLSRRIAAFELFEQRDQLLGEVNQLCEGMRSPRVEEWFGKLVERSVSQGIFPETEKDKDGGGWFVQGKDGSRELSVQSDHTRLWTRRQDADYWYWGVSSSGLVREIRRWHVNDDGSLITQRCSEHLLSQGPEIANVFILQSTRRFFPKLKLD